MDIAHFLRSTITVAVVLLFCTDSFSQVKIGDNPTVVNPSSLLELESTTKGLLLPRIALSQSTIASPLQSHVEGMVVYNTASINDVTPGYYYNDGSKWVKMMESGQINNPTVIGTSPTNTLAITGLQQGNLSTDEIITIDPVTGVLKKTSISSIVKEEQVITVASEGQTQFATPLPITDIDKINVFRNGVRITATMVNANTIQLEAGVVCVIGDEIRIVQIN